jgi:hypothetical protein
MLILQTVEGCARGEMQFTLEAKRVHQSVWHVLCKVQVCSAGDLREQRIVWEVLHGHDHSWQQDQVPLSSKQAPSLFAKYIYICRSLCIQSFNSQCM